MQPLVGVPPAETLDDRAPGATAGVPVPGVVLIVVNGEPVCIPLRTARPLEIGRQIERFSRDERLSRQHLRVDAKAGHFRVRDLGSRNGTFVDGVRVDRVVTDRDASSEPDGDRVLLLAEDVRPFEMNPVTVNEGEVVGPRLRDPRHGRAVAPTVETTAVLGRRLWQGTVRDDTPDAERPPSRLRPTRSSARPFPRRWPTRLLLGRHAADAFCGSRQGARARAAGRGPLPGRDRRARPRRQAKLLRSSRPVRSPRRHRTEKALPDVLARSTEGPPHECRAGILVPAADLFYRLDNAAQRGRLACAAGASRARSRSTSPW